MPGILPGAGQPGTKVLLLPDYWFKLYILPGYQGEGHLPGYQGEGHLPGYQNGDDPSAQCEEKAKPLTAEEEHEEETRFFEAKI